MTSHCSDGCPFTNAAQTLARIDERTSSLVDYMDKVDKAVFTGNGKASLLARVEAIEQSGTTKSGITTKIISLLAILVAVWAKWTH